VRLKIGQREGKRFLQRQLNGMKPTILLRSSWQTQNIGDIAHTPGMLALLERVIPDARIILWYSSVGQGVEAMLRRRFPTLRFVPASDGGKRYADYKEGPRDLSSDQAMDEADILLHGSGPSLVGEREVARFRARVPQKPWGAIGVTLQSPSPTTAALLSTAKFLYTRETHSIEHLKKAGVTGPVMDFAPDASFAHDLRDDARAEEFLRTSGLLGQRFICVIPRLRKTPYYKIHPDPSWTPEAIAAVDRLNETHAESDHSKLRDVITKYVRETKAKVLLCSEMEYQVELQRPLLFDPLPADVKPFVVNRPTYWRNDEAASVYRKAEALIGCECHSPILCAANGITGFYVRQPSDTIKGQMYYDLGLVDRVAEIEEIDAPALSAKFLRLIEDPTAARARLSAAMQKADAAMTRAATGLLKLV
jgi:polysaccharide pyruvyl transferase WcaK-like protein